MVRDTASATRWPQWKSLLPAIAVSIVAHLLLLFTLGVPRAAHAPRAVLVVTLRGATIEPPPRSVPPPAAMAPPARVPEPVPAPKAAPTIAPRPPAAVAPPAPTAAAPTE